MDGYKIVYRGGEGEIIEKKSRFIATVCPINTEEDAVSFIESMKKKYWDARHNCHAFVIGERNEVSRCSDDGEPSGTAGKPMLDVLLGAGVHNVCVVVTRYFGGTLLGTGGLVRAYSRTTMAGLENSIIIEKVLSHRIKIHTDYNGIGKIQYILGKSQAMTVGSEYTDEVTVEILIDRDFSEALCKEITEVTSGKAGIEILEECYCANADGEVIVF
ncbi:MAG: YigZ family protein [Clostridia bacterium]|nr:YigZ family protein [Lachnospiraceae bacterium]NCC00424.1 YigZ family protein [Clostridia bacterium]NCD02623.1 YigZ family protein [Clostridia bacterium]